jgi:hypothetical protein
MQHLVTDDEAAALIQELQNIIENDRYPFSPRIRTLRAILKQAQTGAGSRTLAAAAEGLCATVERQISETRLRGLRDAKSCTKPDRRVY